MAVFFALNEAVVVRIHPDHVDALHSGSARSFEDRGGGSIPPASFYAEVAELAQAIACKAIDASSILAFGSI